MSDDYYTTPRWEKILLRVILVALALVILSGIFTAVKAAADPVDETGGNPAPFAALPDRCNPEVAGMCRVTRFGNKRPTIVAWGDSHMAQQMPGLIAQAKARRVNLVAFLIGGCPPVLGIDFDECTASGGLAMNFIAQKAKANKPVTVVLGAYWDYYLTTTTGPRAGISEKFRRTAPLIFRRLKNLDVRVAAVAQQLTVPDTETCNLSSSNCARAEMLPREQADRAYLANRLAPIRRHRLIDVNHWLCVDGRCVVNVGEHAVFDDVLHMKLNVTRGMAPDFAWATQMRGR